VDKVDAVVLAGAKNDGPLKDVSGALYEAMISINGKPMVKYVIDCLSACDLIGRIIVVGPPDIAPAVGDRGQVVECGRTMVDNIEIGIDCLESEKRVLIVTCDIPLITPAAIRDFLERCEDRDADIYYPIISKEVNDRKYPGVKRTYFQLGDGVFTGGNLVLLGPWVVKRSRDLISQAVSMRKKPWKLSRLLGVRFIVKFFMHRLQLAEIEERVMRIMDLRGAGIISPYPEVGIDVDKPDDLKLVRQVIE